MPAADGIAVMADALTRAELFGLPSVIDIVTTGKASGLGRTLAQALVARCRAALAARTLVARRAPGHT